MSDAPAFRPQREWWHRHLASEERQRVMEELAIKGNAHWSFRFFVMQTLSVIVAVMGLSANSAAVVIGAMLLAPLMTPVLAVAACISMALFRISLSSFGVVVAATLGSIALAWLLSAIFVSGDLPHEVTSRTAPDVRDLVVALGAGTAGAYATVRTDASSSLPGVAVAVALVPPLATVGIALEAGQMTFARGALLLYATNLSAIVLAGVVVFVITGFVPPKRLATMGLRSLMVASGVALAVIVIAVPLVQASVRVAQQSDREIQAREIVDDWLGTIDVTQAPSISFQDDRILVSVRSFEDPPDGAVLVAAMQAQFGADRTVSTEWDRVERAETTTTLAPTTTVVTDEELLLEQVETLVDAWLADGAPSSGRRRDALVLVDGIVVVDASGVGDPPSVQDLTDRLDEVLEETFEVQLTWLERENVSAGEPEPTPDEVLQSRVEVVAGAWATTNDLVLQDVAVVDGNVVVDVTGPELPDATPLVEDIEELVGPDGEVRVLFTQRLDITTTTSTTTTTTLPVPTTTTP